MSDISELLAPLINRASAPAPVEDLERQVRRRRRTRRVTAAVGCAAVISAATLTAFSLTGRSASYVSVGGGPPASNRVVLPAGQLVQSISVVNGGLLLSGQSSASPQVCIAIPVDPATLAFGRAQHGDCDNPALSGHRVGVIVNQRGSSGPNLFEQSVRVDTIDPQTGTISAGPVLFNYSDSSDTRPVWVYGGDRLWVYDVDTAHGPEVVQISATTGQVQATIPMPKLYRPIVAADDDGLWIGESIEGTAQGVDTLYRVAPGAKTATTVVSGKQVVRWLLAAGHHVWVGTTPPDSLTQEIWRFDGFGDTPVFRVAEAGFNPTSVIGDETDGLWTMQWDPPLTSGVPHGSSAQQVVRIDPDTGAEQVVANLPPIPVPLPGEGADGLLSGQATVLDGAVYLLEPPFRANGYQGYSTLIRIPASGPPVSPTRPSLGTTPISATPSHEPTTAKVIVTPAEGLHNGQRVEVAVTGFPHIGEKVFLSECASAAVVNSIGCGDQLAGQVFFLTDDQGSGTTSFVVNSSAATGPLKAPVVPCSTRCVIEATIGAAFAGPPPVYAWSTLNFSAP